MSDPRRDLRLPPRVDQTLESGSAELNRWKLEERDYVADDERLFGERPDALLGISIMTDSDNTHSTAVAYYDFIELDAGSVSPPRS